jgi:N-acetylmuramate 1-kinase
MPDTSATREQQRLDWAREATGATHAALLRASTDAGFRSYWRTDGIAPPLIVMDSPPEQEDVAPWLQVRDLLEAGGVRVPRVLAEDRVRGFLLLEDLGTDTLLHVLDPDNADALVEASLAELLRLQAIPVPAGFPAYDRALLERELGLFDAWFLERHLGVVLDVRDREALASAGAFLVERALAQPQVLVHRDYMPRNLMPVAGGVAVLDFQDAVRGPVAYDPTSLFKDAFLSWPAARVEAWLERYHTLAIDAGLPVPPLARFHEDAALIGVQRHLKVLGIFARLHHRDGKPKYLADAPRFVAYLDEVVPRYPALSGLDRLLDRHVRPVFAAGAGAAG